MADRDRVDVGEHQRRDRVGFHHAREDVGYVAVSATRCANTAVVVATTKCTAEEWLEPGAISPGGADPRAYLIVREGRFICIRCSYPAGAKPPRGRPAQSIWVPGQGVSDFGLTQRVPGGLDKLGRVVKINLLAPAVTASDLAQAKQGT